MAVLPLVSVFWCVFSGIRSLRTILQPPDLCFRLHKTYKFLFPMISHGVIFHTFFLRIFVYP